MSYERYVYEPTDKKKKDLQSYRFAGIPKHHQESFEGKIYEVSIYNRIISAIEAAEHYQAARIAPAGQ